jgi:hypothetical protein
MAPPEKRNDPLRTGDSELFKKIDDMKRQALQVSSSNQRKKGWMTRLTCCIFVVVLYAACSTFWIGQVHQHVEQAADRDPKDLGSSKIGGKVAVVGRKTETAELNGAVAFVVVITGCGQDNVKGVPFQIAEGAAVLKHSIHRTSIHGSGRYDYVMYALYHPEAAKCAQTLTDLGYVAIERNTPVNVTDIRPGPLASASRKTDAAVKRS